jgi:hypothetical protein
MAITITNQDVQQAVLVFTLSGYGPNANEVVNSPNWKTPNWHFKALLDEIVQIL